jgi:hypothetical protein
MFNSIMNWNDTPAPAAATQATGRR